MAKARLVDNILDQVEEEDPLKSDESHEPEYQLEDDARHETHSLVNRVQVRQSPYLDTFTVTVIYALRWILVLQGI